MKPAWSSLQIIAFGVILSACSSDTIVGTQVSAPGNAPIIQTKPPIIYLKDNLDEKDQLGWCFDTKGRGLTDQLHAHSCKPTSDDALFVHDDDVLFHYDNMSGQIRSATYANKCAQILAEDAEVDFGLLDCDGQSSDQQFDYNALTSEFHPRDKADQCIAVGGTSAVAGPYMSRALLLVSCDEVDPSLRQWAIFAGG